MLFGILRLGKARRLGRTQQLERLAKHRCLDLRFLVALLRLLDEVGHAPLEAVQVGEHQLGLDRLRVRDRIYAAFDVGNVAAFEAAQDVHDRVHFADVGEELVAETFALRRAADEPGDVDELDLRLDLLRGPRDFLDRVEARVRNCDAADVRLDRRRVTAACAAAVSVKALNRVDLPTFGRPTMPQRKPMGV